MNKMLGQLFTKLSAMTQSGGRSSAMRPMLCLAGLSFLAIFVTPDIDFVNGLSLKVVPVGIFFVSTVAAIVAYFVLLSKDPRYLQSENFQLVMRQYDYAAQQLGHPIALMPTEDASESQKLTASRDAVDVDRNMISASVPEKKGEGSR